MPRIRTIKPEFWTSEQVVECSRDARLLFIGLWNFCDDHGRHKFSPRSIKAEIFPADDISSANVLELLRELSRNGLIRFYTVDDVEYLYVTGWHHQRIDKRQPAKYPEPPAPDNEHSTTIPGIFPPDSKGREGIREEGNPSSPVGDTADYDAKFETLWGTSWNAYETPKGSKQEAKTEWNRHVARRGVDPDLVLDRAAAYCAEAHRTKTKTKHVCRWLKHRMFEDEIEPPATNGNGVYSVDEEYQHRVDAYRRAKARGIAIEWDDHWGPPPEGGSA